MFALSARPRITESEKSGNQSQSNALGNKLDAVIPGRPLSPRVSLLILPLPPHVRDILQPLLIVLLGVGVPSSVFGCPLRVLELFLKFCLVIVVPAGNESCPR
jgi:hypothetical protein